MADSPVLRAALELARAGFSVIPIDPTTKKSRVEWVPWQKARATETLIRGWWRQHPKDNVAIITGPISGVVVVDGDTKKLTQEEIDAFQQEHPTPWVVATGGGGRHFYYRYPETGAYNRVAKELGQFDVRAQGGYVVVPPSVHNLTGKKYRWVLKRGKVSSLPSYSVDWFGKVNIPDRQSSGEKSTKESKEKWLADVLGGVGEGGRNDAATKLAGYYFSRGMAYDVVMTLMDQWNEKNDPPIPGRELNATLKSVWQVHMRNGGNIHTPKFLKKNDAPKLHPGQDPFAVVPISAYMVEHGAASVTWTINDWLPDKTIAMAVAPPGTYKTWATFDAGISIASGTAFLNRYKINNPGPVIIVQQEDFHGQIAERLATIWRAREEFGVQDANGEFTFDHPSDIPLYIHPDRRLRFSDETVMDALEKSVSDIRPRLIIIDPLYSAGDTDDYMASTVQAMFRLKEMRDRYGCSFLLAHHTKKAVDGTGREGLWGSQFLNAFLETGWQFRRRDVEGEILVRRHFKVSQNAPEEVIAFDIQTSEPVRYDPRVRGAKDTETSRVGVMDVLTQIGSSTEAELSSKTGKSLAEVRRLLNNLGKIGSVVLDPVTKRWDVVLRSTNL